MRCFNCQNKLLYSLLVSFMFVGLTSSVSFAKNSIPNSYSTVNSIVPTAKPVSTSVPAAVNRENLRDVIKKEVVKKKGLWMQKKAEVRRFVVKRVQGRVLLVVRRYKAVIVRYEKLMSRIEKRIEQEKAVGKDTADVEAELVEIRSTVEQAKPVVDASVSKLSAINENSSKEDIIAVIKDIRVTLKSQKENLVSLKKSIRKLIADLHSLSVENKGDNGTN